MIRYCQRKGVYFSALWLAYGPIPQPSSYTGKDDWQTYVNQVLAEASSIYFVTLVIMQWFNLMATRTRRLSIFQQPPAFNKATQNLWLFPAILFALVVIFIFCYIPGLDRTIASSKIPVEYFFLPMAFGFWILLVDELRKYWARKYPKGWVAWFAW